MATNRVSDLPAVTKVNNGDLVHISQSGSDKSIVYSDFIDGVASATSSVSFNISNHTGDKTFGRGDIGSLIRIFEDGGDITLTLPNVSDVAWSIGDEIRFFKNTDNYDMFLVEGVGVTTRSAVEYEDEAFTTKKLNGEGVIFTLVYIADDFWVLSSGSDLSTIADSTAAIQAEVDQLFALVGVNTDDLSQEIINRAAADTQEIQDRIDAINNTVQLANDAVAAAVQQAIDGDISLEADIQADLSTINTNVSTAQSTADSAVTTSTVVLSRINDTLGDGSDQPLETLAQQQVTLQANLGTAQSTANSAVTTSQTVLSRINDTLGDSSDQTLETLAQQQVTLQADVVNARSVADSALTDASTALSTISDTDGDVSALTLRVQTNETNVANAEGDISSLVSRQTATESELDDVFGDGSNITLSSFASDVATLQSTVSNEQAELDTVSSLATSTEARLNSVDGVTSGRTIESLVSSFDDLDDDVTANAAASVAGISAVDVRVDGLDDRLDSVDGNGKTIEVLASEVNTVSASASTATTLANAAQADADTAQSTANSAQSDANSAASDAEAAQVTATAAVSSASAANVRIDNIDNEAYISAIASDLSTVSVDVGNLESTVTTQSTAINDLETGVSAQWEVKASVGNISGSVGLYNKGGTTTFAVDANAFEVWDSSTDSVTPMFEVENGEAFLNGSRLLEDSVSEYNAIDGISLPTDLTVGPAISPNFSIDELFGEEYTNQNYSPSLGKVKIHFSAVLRYKARIQTIANTLESGEGMRAQLFVGIYRKSDDTAISTRSMYISELEMLGNVVYTAFETPTINFSDTVEVDLTNSGGAYTRMWVASQRDALGPYYVIHEIPTWRFESTVFKK